MVVEAVLVAGVGVWGLGFQPARCVAPPFNSHSSKYEGGGGVGDITLDQSSGQSSSSNSVGWAVDSTTVCGGRQGSKDEK